jgi:hypothetical protein
MIDLIPKLWAWDRDVDYSDASETARVVADRERVEHTGILDQWGNPIPYPKVKVGFGH